MTVGADDSTQNTAPSYDYDSLYVTDADGDGENDLLFLWNGYDLSEGYAAVTQIGNRIDQATMSLAGTPGDGYLYSNDIIDMTPYMPHHTATDGEGATVYVLEDMTWEMVLLQVDAAYAANKDGTLHVAPVYFNALGASGDNAREEYGFMRAIYGVMTVMGEGDASKTPVQVASEQSWTGLRFVGNPRGETYTIGFSTSYTMTDDITGTVKFSFLRDSGFLKTYTGAYDAHYIGTWKPFSVNLKETVTAIGSGRMGLSSAAWASATVPFAFMTAC